MLTVREHMVLQLESHWWKYAGAKDAAILERLGWTPTRYYQVLNALIERPDAHVAYPQVVARLLRLREARATVRGARRVGWMV